METKKVTLVNNLPGRRGITLPHIPFRATFPMEGARVIIPIETLQAIRYEPGVEYFLKNGVISILEEDGRTYLKEELGLNPQEILTKEEIEKLLAEDPKEFRVKFTELTSTNQEKVIDFLVKGETVSFNINNIIKEITGMDVINKIRILQAEKEDEERLARKE